MKQISLILTFLSIQVITSSCSIPSTRTLTFSNTQTWIPAWKELGTKRLKSSKDNLLIELPAPPESLVENPIIQKEIALLLDFQKRSRSPEMIQQILIDREISGWTLGEFVFNDHMSAATPLGRSLLRLFNDTLPDILAQKLKFDRVRAFRFDPRIRPTLETPGHASYPSGHSSSVFFFAHLLSDIVPVQKDLFFCDAARIAVEREIAGVHYPSDSEAGRLWAQAFYQKWKAIPENQKGVQEIKKWWTEVRSKFLAERAYRKPKLIGPRVCTLAEARNYFLHPQGTSVNSLKTKW